MTPKQLQAMKQALEALELINIEFVCGNGSHHKKEDRHEWDEDCPITNRWRKAITAIKEALAQPEQEPVATVAEVHMSRYTIEWTNGPLPEGTKLYTTPPQRKPLTDEAISNIWCKVSNTDFVTVDTHEFARAIEAAHGIKE